MRLRTLKRYKLIVFCIFLLSFFIFLIFFTSISNGSYNYSSKIEYLKSNNKFLFCLILTTPKGFKMNKAQVVLNLWANKCDNFRFVSLAPESIKMRKFRRSITNEFQEEEEQEEDIILIPEGLANEKYHNLTNKVLLTFRHLYREFKDYDWYLKADDDTFVHVENLRYFLQDKNPKQAVTFGYDFKLFVDHGYHSGGAGYVLSNEAFTRIGSKLNQNLSFCQNSGIEDVDVAKCLRNLGVYPNRSVDSLNRERFNPLSLINTYTGLSADWLYNYSANSYKRV